MSESRDVIAAEKWPDFCSCCGEVNVYQPGEETNLISPDGEATRAKNVIFNATEAVFEIIEGPYIGVKLHFLRKKPN